MPVYAVDDQPTMAEDPDGDVEVPEVQQFSVDEQPLSPPADPTEAELHRSTQEVCERLMKVSKDAIDKAVANRPKHIQDLIDAPYEPNPICQVSDEELAEAKKKADELAERMRNGPPPKPPPPPPLPPDEAEAKRKADFDADMAVIEELMKSSAKFIEDAVANRPQHIQDLIDGKVEWDPPSKKIQRECEAAGDLTEGCVYNKMMDNFAANCPYHLLTQKGKTYDEMQNEFAAACPYHLIL